MCSVMYNKYVHTIYADDYLCYHSFNKPEPYGKGLIKEPRTPKIITYLL